MKKVIFILALQSICGITHSATYKSTLTSIKVVSPSGASLAGKVDSSLLNRFSTQGNAIYVYAGTVTPGEMGSAQSPVAVIPITQSKCEFTYQSGKLTKGTYTLAITQQANLDKPTSNDGISFLAVTTVNYVNDTIPQIYNFAPKGKILQVGPGKTYSKPSLAINAANSGDVIEVDSGVYQDDFAVISKNLTLRGVGPTRPHIQRLNATIPNGKGIWTTTSNASIENFEISGSRVPDQNGAGIRIENDTTICNCYLHNNENGVLGDAKNIRIEYSEVAYNGLTDVGYTHNIYVNADIFTLIYSYVHDAYDPNNTTDTGHNVKTRSRTNYILYNRIMNEDLGRAGDQINIPQGGLTYIVGNVIRESSRSSSNRIILFYDNGNDGVANPSRTLYLVNNTIVSDDGEAYYTPGTGTTSYVYNNFLFGSPKTISGNTQSNNIFSTDAKAFTNKSAYDFHLSSTAPAVNAGVDVRTINGFGLNIDSEYVHPAANTSRRVNQAIDAGAFEY